MNKSILQPFEQYQKARTQFVQSIAELATRPQNIEFLQKAGVMALLRPLLLDNVPSIQQSAALALGRLAAYSYSLANDIVNFEILPQLVFSLQEQNKFYKKAASFVLRSVAKHNPSLAQSVVDSNALESLVNCLEEFDNSVKENAAQALSFVAKHNETLANSVVESGAVPLLVLCIQEPEISLKKIAAQALSEICKHNPDLAQKVVDQRAVPFLTSLISQQKDPQLKRQVCACLAKIAKHSSELAQEIVNHSIFPKIFGLLKDQDQKVKKNAAICIREIAKHNHDLAHQICNAGGSAALVEYISDTKGAPRLPGIMTLGYIAAFSENDAMSIINSKGIPPLKDALIKEAEDHIQAAAAWTLGQLGSHSYQHAKAMADNDVSTNLLAIYKLQESSEDLKDKAKRGLKNILVMCTQLESLENLIKEAPDEILYYILMQFKKILPTDPTAKKSFILKNCLKDIQQKLNSNHLKLKQCIEEINSFFPQEIVQYLSPDYAETLINRFEEQGFN